MLKMRSITAFFRSFVLNPAGTNRLQFCPMRTCQTFTLTKLENSRSSLNSKNSNFMLDPVRNDNSGRSNQSLSLEVENDECVNLEQNVGADRKDTSIIEPCNEDVSTFAPYFRPSFNFAAYVNNSPTLQELVKLGVDLHTLEKKKGVPEFILKMEFNQNMKEHIR